MHSPAQRGLGKQPRRIERRQRRIGVAGDQGNLGAAENHRIAPPLVKLEDDVSKILTGTVLEATVDQLTKDNVVDTLTFLGFRDFASNAVV